MADSEVRQKFEAYYGLPVEKLMDSFAAWQEAYSAGMRAGEIARWIPVEEKLPEIASRFGPGGCYGESAPALAFTAYNGQICTAVVYLSGEWATIAGSRLPRVTHWQPLPAAPEEKK